MAVNKQVWYNYGPDVYHGRTKKQVLYNYGPDLYHGRLKKGPDLLHGRLKNSYDTITGLICIMTAKTQNVLLHYTMHGRD